MKDDSCGGCGTAETDYTIMQVLSRGGGCTVHSRMCANLRTRPPTISLPFVISMLMMDDLVFNILFLPLICMFVQAALRNVGSNDIVLTIEGVRYIGYPTGIALTRETLMNSCAQPSRNITGILAVATSINLPTLSIGTNPPTTPIYADNCPHAIPIYDCSDTGTADQGCLHRDSRQRSARWARHFACVELNAQPH